MGSLNICENATDQFNPRWSRYIQIWWNMIKRYKTLVQHISAPHEKQVPSWRAMPSLAKFILWPEDCVRPEDRFDPLWTAKLLARWRSLMSSTSIKRYQTASPTGSYRINSYKHIQIYIKLHKYTNTYKYHQIPRVINRGPIHSHEEFFVATLAGHSCSLAGGLLWFVVACCGNVWQCGELQPMVTVLNPGSVSLRR